MNKNDFFLLIKDAFLKEAIKKIVFSRPKGEKMKITCRLCAHRGRRLLVMESSFPTGAVAQKNVGEEALIEALTEAAEEFSQINLITTLGDAEWKTNKKGSEVVLGGDALKRRLSGDAPSFESAIESLDKKKNYILSGEEEFLKRLGISSEMGRVHDKRQAKFRQINKFLEHVEEIYPTLPRDKELVIYDLCCGKSYLSFALYYYLTERRGRRVSMRGADLKGDVISWCCDTARELGFSGMSFECCDISKMEIKDSVDMVISLHACDIATDIVIDTAIRLGAKVILSTPCCHRYLSKMISCSELSFVTEFSHLSDKLCEALTDGLRILRLKAGGYSVSAPELTDPENTPKNTLIRAIKNPRASEASMQEAREKYYSALKLLLGDGWKSYLEEF